MMDNIRKQNYILKNMTQSFKGYITCKSSIR